MQIVSLTPAYRGLRIGMNYDNDTIPVGNDKRTATEFWTGRGEECLVSVMSNIVFLPLLG